MVSILANEPIFGEGKTVAEVVSQNINTAHVFKKHGIDFCCGGGVSVHEVCLKKGIDYAKLVTELEQVVRPKAVGQDFNSWELTKLVNYIVDVHHRYVKENSQIMIQYADKVARVHGHHYSELLEVKELVHQTVNEMQTHMQKEEHMLFPYIIKLEQHKKEISVNVDFLAEMLEEKLESFNQKRIDYVKAFHENLLEGIQYYQNLKFDKPNFNELSSRILDGLDEAETKIKRMLQGFLLQLNHVPNK